MRHFQGKCSDLIIDRREVYLTLGYGENTPDESIVSLVEEVYAEIDKISRPQYLYEIYPAKKLDVVSVEINGARFKTGKMIASYLDGMERCCVFTTTAGSEYDSYKKQLKADGDILKEFIADALGSVIAEACVTKISEELSEIETVDHTYSYSPGYCGWKLTEQQILFSLLPDAPCGITLTDSCLMLPIKSVSGIIGLGENIERKAYGCSICENVNCYKRKEL